jgi:ATP/maltotriose-dependent transcriptional regulator MalT
MITRPNAPLIGRDDVMMRLRCALSAAQGGAGTCVIVEGPAGIGKSRLLAEAGREAHAMGIVVATARATELDRIAPLTTLLMALRGSQPPVLDSAGMASLDTLGTQQGNAFWVVNQLSLQIEKYAADRPLLISLDDVQWADELTALALRILIPALTSSSVLWLLASRPLVGRSPTHEVLDWLTAEGAQLLTLEPLPDEAMVALSAQILGTEPSAEALALARRTGGNPFLLEELLTAFQRTGWERGDAPDDEDADHGDLPWNLLETVDFRLRRLTRTARQVLDAGAVLGRGFTVPELAGVVGSLPADIDGALAELVDEGLLTGTGDELEFRHDLIRDAVYSQLTASSKRRLHGEAGRVLLGKSRPVMEVATHLLRGARKGDAATISLLRQAAADIASTAPSTAADLMQQVLPLLNDRDPDLPPMVATTVRLLASASRLTEARKLGEAALRFRLTDATEAAMLLGLAEALKHAGHDAAAVGYARRALSRPSIPSRLQAQLLAIQAHAMLGDGDIDGADEAAARAIEVGTACEESSAVVFGSAARSAVAQSQGRVAKAISLAGGAVELADLAAGEARHRHPRLWLARALVAADRFGEAEAVYELGEREAQESGAAWSLPLWHRFRAELELAAGNLDDAQAEAESGVALAEQLTAWALAPSLLTLLSRIAVHRGDISAAEQHLRKARQSVRRGKGGERDALLWSRAVLHEAAGEVGPAMRTLGPVYAELPRRPLLLILSPNIGPHLVRLARRAGNSAHARAAAATARQVSNLNPDIASLVGAAAHARGVLDDDLAALRAAVSSYRSSPRRLARASALEDAGLAEGVEGNRGVAVHLLEEAHQHFSESGARRDAARVEQELRGVGVRRRALRAPSRAKEGVDSLTESELRVVALAAEGLTNRAIAERLFLSPHTVDTHLRHSFGKLGVSSRVELTRVLLLHKDGEEVT